MRSPLRNCRASMKIHLVRENLVKDERRIWIAPVDNFIFRLPARLPSNSSVISPSTRIRAHTYITCIWDHLSVLSRQQRIETQGQHGASSLASLVATYPPTGWTHVSKGSFKSVFAAFRRGIVYRVTDVKQREGRNKGTRLEFHQSSLVSPLGNDGSFLVIPSFV